MFFNYFKNSNFKIGWNKAFKLFVKRKDSLCGVLCKGSYFKTIYEANFKFTENKSKQISHDLPFLRFLS